MPARPGDVSGGEGKGWLAAMRRDQQAGQGAYLHRLFPSTVARIGSLGWGLFLLGLALLAAGPAGAQISPGPLAEQHQFLDGAIHCTECHKLGSSQPEFRCIGCHSDIGARIAAKRGLHASYRIPAGSSQECSRCHSDHNGVTFPMIKWEPTKFDHKETGYLLEGKHAGLACNKCHTPERIPAAERAAIKMKDLSKTFLGIPQACVTCHKDFHEGRLGPNCIQCHNFTDWKDTAGKFDHSKTRYPLTGLHQEVKCEKCHTADATGAPRYKGLPFGKCDDCHADPHKGSFKDKSCASCHNTNGWKKVSNAGLSNNFDHSKTKYPLVGKHLTVECEACHAKGDFKKELAFAKCTDCHKDDHNGQFAKRPKGIECEQCHKVEGWKPSLFDVKAHEKTDYPLVDGHAMVKCAGCHVPKGKETQFTTVKFKRCTDCHKDEHNNQFAGKPYENQCDQCHNLKGYSPSTFTLALHKKTKFELTGGHVAIPCGDCHKLADKKQPKALVPYHFADLSCTSCHEDIHHGQFQERMVKVGASGQAAGCTACHGTKSWHELDAFDHNQTTFKLEGAHRAVACIDCHKPPNLETKMLNVDFKKAPGKCEDCHEDAHGGQFAKLFPNQITLCSDCHNASKWKPSLFDHDKRTTFALEGEHRNVACAGCHKLFKAVDGKQVLFYAPTPKLCSDCHGPEVKQLKKG
ncbi:MAG TPA: cytochrome c3 family protein [Terriglobales bacterium]|jgi:predicted CXXCH cytochrome family protein|nr:cytochrome c3 family protein [Terriglobales bacterium]